MLAIIWLALQVADHAIHVSPDGNDRGSGTREAPFRTPARARDAARDLLRAGSTTDVVIRLRGGRYELAEPLRLGPEDSGTPTRRVVWESEAGEKAVLSGGTRVEGWTREEGAVWRVDLPEARSFRNLYRDGRRWTRARAPDEGTYRIVKAGPDDRTSFTFEAGHLKAWPDVREAEVVFHHDWSVSRIRIASVDEAAGEVKLQNPVGPGAKHYSMSWFEKRGRYFVENARALLDQPGEWHLEEGRRLRVVARDGEDPRRTETVIPRLARLLEIRGPVENLVFRNLTFADTEWAVPKGGYAEGQAASFEDRDNGETAGHRAFVPAAVHLEKAQRCQFESCRFERLGGSGLWLAAGCHENLVTGSVFSGIAANGVMVGLGGEARRGGADLVGRGNRILECLIEECGEVFFGAVGAWVGITESTIVARNEIRRLPYTGVSLGWVWNATPGPAKSNVIEQNHIHHVMQVLSDGAGIYTLGRQPESILRGNHIHDIPLNAGRAESNGIFMDEGTADFLVERNVIWNVQRSPVRFHKAFANAMRGNTLVCGKGVPAFRYNACTEKDKAFEANATPGADTFTAPAPLTAGPRER